VGLEVGALGFAAPAAIGDGSVFGEAALDTGAVWSPSVRIGLHRTLDASADVSGGSGTLTWTFGRAEACPVRLAMGRAVDARPCAAIDAGTLSAAADGVAHAQSRVRLWSAAGGLLRLRWSVFDQVRVEVDGGALAPLVRESFVLLPSTAVYEAPPLAMAAGLGIAIDLR
jgi:hypothetical protein